MVFVKSTIGSEIILAATDELLGNVGHEESLFFPFGGCVSVGVI
jgi:hypothetical protein